MPVETKQIKDSLE